jgi:hypothetical protein
MGCYSQLHRNTNLRIIGLFSLVTDLINPHAWNNNTNPLGILTWLEDELHKAESNSESVFIINHFSINAYFMHSQWGYRFRILVDRYANQIRGIFAGHTHEDSFQIFKSKFGDDIAGVLHIVPSLTTHTEQNPSFRVYVADKKTFSILDYHQYRLYISEANANDNPEWKIAYSFKENFKVSSMEYSNYLVIVEKLQKNEVMFKKFVRDLWAEGPLGDKLLATPKTARTFVKCRLIPSDMYEYLDCIGTHYGSTEYKIGYGFLVKVLNLDWEYAYYP